VPRSPDRLEKDGKVDVGVDQSVSNRPYVTNEIGEPFAKPLRIRRVRRGLDTDGTYVRLGHEHDLAALRVAHLELMVPNVDRLDRPEQLA
jgi:hypothetical protein